MGHFQKELLKLAAESHGASRGLCAANIRPGIFRPERARIRTRRWEHIPLRAVLRGHFLYHGSPGPYSTKG